MKKKLKLAFAQLEHELMTIDTADELKSIKGGFTTDDVINYFTNIGFQFSQDSSGNYSAWGLHQDPATSIMVQEITGPGRQWMELAWQRNRDPNAPHYGGTLSGITVVGSGNSSGGSGDWPPSGDSGDTGWNDSGDYSSGWDYGSMNGSYDFNYFLDMYTSLTSSSYSDYTPTPPADPYDGPFKRDANGNIIATNTGNTIMYDAGSVQLEMQPVIMKTKDGTDVIGYKVVEACDVNGNPVPLTDNLKSNCFGYATAGGEYWFFDNPATGGVNEGAAYDAVISSMYEQCSAADATLAVVYRNYGDPLQMAYHAGVVNPDGTFTAKGATGEVTDYSSEAAFRDGGAPAMGDNYYTIGQIIYYKLK